MKMNKKGQIFDQFGSLAIGVGALCITLVVAFLIMAQANSNMRADSTACPSTATYFNSSNPCCLDTPYGLDKTTLCTGANLTGYSEAYNATGTLQTATAGIPGWVSIIIITAIGAALIGMVAMFKR